MDELFTVFDVEKYIAEIRKNFKIYSIGNFIDVAFCKISFDIYILSQEKIEFAKNVFPIIIFERICEILEDRLIDKIGCAKIVQFNTNYVDNYNMALSCASMAYIETKSAEISKYIKTIEKYIMENSIVPIYFSCASVLRNYISTNSFTFPMMLVDIEKMKEIVEKCNNLTDEVVKCFLKE